MKIRRIKVLLAKGWCKVVCFVSFSLLSIVCNHASAREQSVSAVVTQDVIKAGDLISGRVTDGVDPLRMANITERDSKYRIVAHSVTDIEGKFALRLVNPADKLEITYVGYQTVDTVINSTYYEIRMKENDGIPTVKIADDRKIVTMYGPLPPSISMDEFEDLGITTVEDNLQAYGAGAGLDLVWNPGSLIDRPQLVLDGNIIIPESTAWAGFDLTKTEYSKDEISRLFGVKARKIKSVTILKGEAATSVWGVRARAGVIEVQTRKGYRKMKRQAR